MAEKKMQLVDWLDDLCVRFIINLPQEELESVARICFQVEEAQWFYEDFIRPIDPSLPSLNLRDFCLRIFQHCPLLSAFSDSQHTAAYQEFLAYKTRVPVRGAILLNEDMDEVVLVKGWKKGSGWSFPRGKINKDEDDLDCAIREVYEETGYDVRAAGLATKNHPVKAIDVTMREQHLRMFVFQGVPLDTHFEPKTRKEISKIQWYKLADLPTFKKNKNNQGQGQGTDLINANKFYMVAPFLVPLKKWINQQRKRDLERSALDNTIPEQQDILTNAAVEELEKSAPVGVDITQPPVEASIDPAFELKRLLSVGTQSATLTAPTPTYADPTQANTLLAMLRGGPSSGLAVPNAANALPKTPMEQITGFPPEPASPHYRHAKESPHVTREPPPPFSLSPRRNGFQEAARASMYGPPGMNGRPEPSHQAYGFPPLKGPPAQIHHPLHPDAFALQGPGSMPSHGPVAPKASQLPPPKLSNHAISLLNAFKGPASHPSNVAPPASNTYVTQQNQHQQPAFNPQQHASPQRNSSAWNNYAAQSESRQYQVDSEAVAAASRAAAQLQHATQNAGPTQQTWKETFKQTGTKDNWHGSPRQVINTQHTVHGQPTALNQPYTMDNQLATPFATPAHLGDSPVNQQPSVQQPTNLSGKAGPVSDTLRSPERRKVSVNEITRTLPKTRLTESGSSANVPAANTIFPAKEAVRRTQAAGNENSHGAASGKSSENTPAPMPFKILTRPASSASKGPPVVSAAAAQSPVSPPQQNKTPTNGTNTASFTILQRPSSSKSPSSHKTKQIENPPPPSGNDTPKPFQPQLLRRPKPGANQPASLTAAQPSQSGDNQKDALLALFAKASGSPASPLILQEAQDIAKSPLVPMQVPFSPPMLQAQETPRSRLASNASIGSNGDSRKPSTPIEAKGFLLDYLNGVVKGESMRGGKRS
ncbi:mRNA-decapping enzyme subunit 2 [Taxawa tesnikishii (nom. ined.)]|nr:mRNA-decapping enzyme subunit 2 [Dothideales sp. JES 119]